MWNIKCFSIDDRRIFPELSAYLAFDFYCYCKIWFYFSPFVVLLTGSKLIKNGQSTQFLKIHKLNHSKSVYNTKMNEENNLRIKKCLFHSPLSYYKSFLINIFLFFRLFYLSFHWWLNKVSFEILSFVSDFPCFTTFSLKWKQTILLKAYDIRLYNRVANKYFKHLYHFHKCRPTYFSF